MFKVFYFSDDAIGKWSIDLGTKMRNFSKQLCLLLLLSCGVDDSQIKVSINFDSIRFCTTANANQVCEIHRSQIPLGTTRVYTSTPVSFNTTKSSFSLNWYLVNESGCRTNLSSDTVVPQVDGQQTLTGFYMNTGGLEKGLYELEIEFKTSDSSESTVAQFSVN